MSARRAIGGWLLRAPGGLREGSENSLLAAGGDFEIGEARLGKSPASLDALQYPGSVHIPCQSASWSCTVSISTRGMHGIADGVKRRGGEDQGEVGVVIGQRQDDAPFDTDKLDSTADHPPNLPL